jgi:hypothetical protein
MSFSVVIASDASAAATTDVLPVTVIDMSSDIPTYYAVDIPWFKQETSGSCGAASLRIAFGQLGYHMIEGEIRTAAQTTSTTTLSGDMIRAAHFSNASEEGNGTPIQGYTGKPFGTDSYETGFYDGTPSGKTAANEFKQYLLEGKPVILLMSYGSGGSSGHYRVLRGYDDRKGTFIFTDSLGSGPVSGSQWTVYSDSLYADFWYYSGYWAQIISPWSISLIPAESAIESTDMITAGVTGWINGTGTHPWQVKPYDYCDVVYHEIGVHLRWPNL